MYIYLLGNIFFILLNMSICLIVNTLKNYIWYHIEVVDHFIIIIIKNAQLFLLGGNHHSTLWSYWPTHWWATTITLTTASPSLLASPSLSLPGPLSSLAGPPHCWPAPQHWLAPLHWHSFIGTSDYQICSRGQRFMDKHQKCPSKGEIMYSFLSALPWDCNAMCEKRR